MFSDKFTRIRSAQKISTKVKNKILQSIASEQKRSTALKGQIKYYHFKINSLIS